MNDLEKYIYDSFLKEGYETIIRVEIEKSKVIKSDDNFIRIIYNSYEEQVNDEDIISIKKVKGEKYHGFFESNIIENANSKEGKIVRSALVSYKRKIKLSKI